VPDDVTIVTASAGWWRPGKGWHIGWVLAFSEGHRVSYTKNHGRRCECGSGGCVHVAQVLPLVDPETLVSIREGRRAPSLRLKHEI